VPLRLKHLVLGRGPVSSARPLLVCLLDACARVRSRRSFQSFFIYQSDRRAAEKRFKETVRAERGVYHSQPTVWKRSPDEPSRVWNVIVIGGRSRRRGCSPGASRTWATRWAIVEADPRRRGSAPTNGVHAPPRRSLRPAPGARRGRPGSPGPPPMRSRADLGRGGRFSPRRDQIVNDPRRRSAGFRGSRGRSVELIRGHGRLDGERRVRVGGRRI